MTVPTITLNDGTTIPQLGFGVFQVDPAEAERIVSVALEAGYRHIDTAAIYKNEEGVGRAIAASGIPRDELYITTKLWNNRQGTQSAIDAMDESLGKLGLDHVDLYLIHWPRPDLDKYLETWHTFEQLKSEGKTTSIGVSNFHIPHLERVIAEGGTVPVVDQIELHPALAQKPIREFAAAHGIAIESWSPLGGGKLDIAAMGPVAAAAAAHGVTGTQVIIRWHLQNDIIVFPKSSTPERIVSNFDVFGFELSADEMASIDALDDGTRVGPDPDYATF